MNLRYGIETLDSFVTSALTTRQVVRTGADFAMEMYRLGHEDDNPAAISQFISKTKLSLEQAKYLVGLQFRSVVLKAWLAVRLRNLHVPMTWGYSDFLTKITIPFFMKTHPNLKTAPTPEEFLAERSFLGHARELADDPSIHVITNRNDFLLSSEDINWLEQTLGPGRLQIFESGGHVGNLWWPEMRALLKNLATSPIEEPLALIGN